MPKPWQGDTGAIELNQTVLFGPNLRTGAKSDLPDTGRDSGLTSGPLLGDKQPVRGGLQGTGQAGQDDDGAITGAPLDLTNVGAV